MSTHKRPPLAQELPEDEREIISQIADLNGCTEEEAAEMWNDFKQLASKANRIKKRDRRDWRGKKQ
jgi:flagellar motor switch protein FliG